MISAPLPRASPLGSERLSMIIPRYYGLTITYNRDIDKTRLAGCQDRRELTPKIWARRGARTVEFLK